jgi:hypothetical protein
MRRNEGQSMRRKLITFSSAMSLLLCVLCARVWLSNSRGSLTYNSVSSAGLRVRWFHLLLSYDELFMASYIDHAYTFPDAKARDDALTDSSPKPPSRLALSDATQPAWIPHVWDMSWKLWNWHGFIYAKPEFEETYDPTVEVAGSAPQAGYLFERRVYVPPWFPPLLFAALPFVAACRGLHRYWRSLRPAVKRCPTCGYDLRATPDRCPECGKAAGEKPSISN